jgi:hypothetical protein
MQLIKADAVFIESHQRSEIYKTPFERHESRSHHGSKPLHIRSLCLSTPTTCCLSFSNISIPFRHVVFLSQISQYTLDMLSFFLKYLNTL